MVVVVVGNGGVVVVGGGSVVLVIVIGSGRVRCGDEVENREQLVKLGIHIRGRDNIFKCICSKFFLVKFKIVQEIFCRFVGVFREGKGGGGEKGHVGVLSSGWCAQELVDPKNDKNGLTERKKDIFTKRSKTKSNRKNKF